MNKPPYGNWRALYARQLKKWIVVGYIEMKTGEVRIKRQRVYTLRKKDHPYAGDYFVWKWETDNMTKGEGPE
tara:strand:+ start:2611 stop:2826 length:216 start_codon:yes stop_codon:yes gene_type:complete